MQEQQPPEMPIFKTSTLPSHGRFAGRSGRVFEGKRGVHVEEGLSKENQKGGSRGWFDIANVKKQQA